ncbi:hypothetical protein MMC07_008141 [Pseudocyphellaria aurata]|nr:hypothetical protein [Pseudocyphellaria aurata]
MPCQHLPAQVDTIVIGSGPSALILSFILNGNIPHYNPQKPHPDPILQKKLLNSPSLLDIDASGLTSHFNASRLSYSTQALPINVLLDTLLRPLVDTNPGEYESCVVWRHDGSRRMSHVVLGDSSRPGGQWADNEIAGSWDIGALSYAEMLSLPGYSLEQHLRRAHGNEPLEFYRPTRREVAEYMAVYPSMVKIADSIHLNMKASGILRIDDGFLVRSHNIRCRRLVLASGVFSNLIPPGPSLQPLIHVPRVPFAATKWPLLVVGSGFTAADVILSSPPDQKIIHLFKWNSDRPSPLHACHPRAYPEYATVYRRMKLAASHFSGLQGNCTQLRRRKSTPCDPRNLDSVYEGFPNTSISCVVRHEEGFLITLQDSDGKIYERNVSSLEYLVGRRGSLTYLNDLISEEILGPNQILSRGTAEVSGRTLRRKVEENVEVAPDIFAIGSLTGDSLIRFAFGACVFAAREIFKRSKQSSCAGPHKLPFTSSSSSSLAHKCGCHEKDSSNEYIITNGHADLSIDGVSGKRMQAALN